MKKVEPFFIFDSTLCVKEAGEYKEIVHVVCHTADGITRPLVLSPTFEDGCVVLWSGKGAKRKISTIRKVPQKKQFAGMRIPAGYLSYDLETKPYVLASPKKKRPAP